jgi:hypothetical protein
MSKIVVTKPLDILVTSTCEIYNYENVKKHAISLNLVKQMRVKKPNDETKKLSFALNEIAYLATIEYWKVGDKDVLGISIDIDYVQEIEEEEYEDCLVIDDLYKLPCAYNEPYIIVDNYLRRDGSNLEDEICANLIKLTELIRCYEKRDPKLNYLEVKYKGKKYQIKYGYEIIEYARYKSKRGTKLVIKNGYKKMEDLEVLRIRLYQNITIEKLKEFDRKTEEPKEPVNRMVKNAHLVEKFNRDYQNLINKSKN